MSMFSKLTGLAQKALDSRTGGASSGSASGSTDWRSLVRGAADALTGEPRSTQNPEGRQPTRAQPTQSGAHDRRGATSAAISQTDRAAIARYDYLLSTADPQQIEQVHREAFARLTPEQREQVGARMNEELPAHEHPRSSSSDDLARAAARAEASRPGMLRGLLARAGGASRGRGGGLGGGAALGGAGLLAGGMLGAVAGGAVVSSIAAPLLAQAADFGVDFDALAGSLDIDGLTGGLDGIAGEAGDAVAGVGDQVSGLGDQVSGFGEDFRIPGLDDFFGR